MPERKAYVTNEGKIDKPYFIYVAGARGTASGAMFTGLRFNSRKRAERLANQINKALEEET